MAVVVNFEYERFLATEILQLVPKTVPYTMLRTLFNRNESVTWFYLDNVCCKLLD